ncbi:MAG: RNA polymerase sigma factor [Caldisericota bacterium]|nr:RNA polymerase sigma factor [Caldisericota bacterium]
MEDKLKMLVLQIKSGDKDAFTEFYRLTVRYVYSVVYAYLLSNEDTEDVVQNTYLKLYVVRKRINPEESILAYMKRIAINYAFKQMRQKRQKRKVAIKETSFSKDEGTKELVQEALKKLDEKDRIVLVLHYLGNTPVKEISVLVNEKEGSVKSRLFRARKKLKEVIISEEI